MAVPAPVATPLHHNSPPSPPHLHFSKPKPNPNLHKQPSIPPPPPPPPLTATQTNQQTLLPHSPNSSDFAVAIDSCNCPQLARQIHANAIKTAYCSSQEFLQTRLLSAYSRCSDLRDALQLFGTMPTRSVYSWAAILTACVDHALYRKALLLLNELLQTEAIALDFFVFPVVLKACGGLNDVELAKGLHGLVLKNGFVWNSYVGNALIDVYAKCALLDESFKVMRGMHARDRVSWNSMIAGLVTNGLVFEAVDLLGTMRSSHEVEPNLVSWSAAIGGLAQDGHDEEALELLREMIDSGIQPNCRTLASILPSCGRLRELHIGKEIHGYIVRHGLMSNPFSVNGMIDVYRRCGDMVSALELFSRFSVRNLVSYNTMIVGYCENGELSKARAMFDRMELDGVRRDTISWNSMISGYKINGEFEEGLKVFGEMLQEDNVRADSFTVGSVLSCCAALSALGVGKEVHSYAIVRNLHSNTFVGGALVELYSRCCEDLASAESAFSDIDGRDVTTWNVLISSYARAGQLTRPQELLSSMEEDGFDPSIYTWNGLIAGYLNNGRDELALQMFSGLLTTGLRPDIYTIGMILPACSRLLSIEQGRQVHAYLIRCRYDTHVHVGAAIVDMYAKCGSVTLAELAFSRISQHNLVSLNTMLAGFATHGLVEEGIALFRRMLDDGVTPDGVTFLSVLSLCVHRGACEEGVLYFSMMEGYGIEPELKHYTSMVDLFSRAGKLDEAYRLIGAMPVEADVVVWCALLAGCVTHCNVELGEMVAERVLELEEDNAGNYVMLANLYARAGRREDLARIRRVIGERGMHKIAGCSWIEHGNQVHAFLANCSCSHERMDEVYATAEALNKYMRMLSEVTSYYILP
ncbi:KH domain-containing proteinisoform X2 [Iris pallida]|uniref:KH domain-containing proteinisoform X2 n=1 Tax=Iris pallida TaxID=29817 RepID=A0AAX6FV75_IRIPA|nr:KH domain-containing proteinisoform X2 [Iris pallida]